MQRTSNVGNIYFMNLPKEYLSWSQINVWLKSKEQYRQQYYFGKKSPDTPQMMYGREIAEALENNDPTLAHIPRYANPEQSLKVTLDGIPLIGYLDSYDPKKHTFLEYKTSSSEKTWNALSVRKHDQLTMYSMMIEEQYGKVRNLCHLVELKTAWKTKTVEFDGIMLEGISRELMLTGEFNMFPRRIEKWERERMKEIIKRVATEIEQDYATYAT